MDTRHGFKHVWRVRAACIMDGQHQDGGLSNQIDSSYMLINIFIYHYHASIASDHEFQVRFI